MVNTITIFPVVHGTCRFINEITVPYLKYWNYAQMDVAFVNTMQRLRPCKCRVIHQRIPLPEPPPPPHLVLGCTVYPYFLETKIMGV